MAACRGTTPVADMTTRSQRSRLFEIARSITAVLAVDFYGTVSIAIQNGKAGVVRVVQTLKDDIDSKSV